MKDATGLELKAGDIVAIPAKIIASHDAEGKATLQIRTLAPDSDGILDTIGSIDAATVFRANDGDSSAAFGDLVTSHQVLMPKAATVEADDDTGPSDKPADPVGGDVAGDQPADDHEDHGDDAAAETAAEPVI